jgi:NTE family protein
MQTLKPTKPVIALVLGGGGAKGFAHVGVIKALEARGIKPDLIVGSSVGSFVGSLYASGMTANHLEHLALTTTDNELTDFTLAYQGIIEGVKLKDFVNAQVGQRPIEALPIRFAAVATEKHTGKQAVFTSGNTGLIVQASCSVPNVFIAPRIPEQVGKKYVDGGVSSLVPVDAARALGADVVIAVDITDATPTSKADGQRNIWSMMEQSYVAMQNTAKDGTAKGKYSQGGLPVSQGEVNRADVIIRPKVAHISSVDTSRRSETITAGEKAANEKLAAIAEAIAKAAINPDIK